MRVDTRQLKVTKWQLNDYGNSFVIREVFYLFIIIIIIIITIIIFHFLQSHW